MAAQAKDANTIDESLYSRQLYVMGKEAQMKLSKANVLISGLSGAGVEAAKNIILAGVNKVVLNDDTVCTYADQGSQFYVTDDDVAAGRSRAEASRGQLQELNRYVDVSIHTGAVTAATLKVRLLLLPPTSNSTPPSLPFPLSLTAAYPTTQISPVPSQDLGISCLVLIGATVRGGASGKNARITLCHFLSLHSLFSFSSFSHPLSLLSPRVLQIETRLRLNGWFLSRRLLGSQFSNLRPLPPPPHSVTTATQPPRARARSHVRISQRLATPIAFGSWQPKPAVSSVACSATSASRIRLPIPMANSQCIAT